MKFNCCSDSFLLLFCLVMMIGGGVTAQGTGGDSNLLVRRRRPALPKGIGRGASLTRDTEKLNNGLEGILKQLHRTTKRSETPIVVESEEGIPSVLKPWLVLHKRVSKMCLPGGSQLEVGITLLSAMVFIFMDYFVGFVLQAQKLTSCLPHAQRRSVAGSLVTLFHASSLIPGVGACIWWAASDSLHHRKNRTDDQDRKSHNLNRPCAKMSAAPQWWQDSVTTLLQFCTGYMIYDALIQFGADKWVPGQGFVLSAGDWMFLGHHFATAFYMTSTRIAGAGHVSALLLMFAGEFTAPMMNLRRIGRIVEGTQGCAIPLVTTLYPYVNWVYALLYASFRIVVGPLLGVYISYDLIGTKEGRANVPLGLSIAWLTMCWGVIIGSIPWIKDAISILT
jgi:hypothetical protein